MRMIIGLILITVSCFTFYVVINSSNRIVTEETVSVATPPTVPTPPTATKGRTSVQVQSPTQEFHQELESFLLELPTSDNLKKTGNPELDFHRSPIELAEIAPIMADVRDRANERPELVSEAMWFFDKCARKEKILPAVGSVCLHHLRTLSKRTQTQIDFSSYPAHLNRLSEKLSFAE